MERQPADTTMDVHIRPCLPTPPHPTMQTGIRNIREQTPQPHAQTRSYRSQINNTARGTAHTNTEQHPPWWVQPTTEQAQNAKPTSRCNAHNAIYPSILGAQFCDHNNNNGNAALCSGARALLAECPVVALSCSNLSLNAVKDELCSDVEYRADEEQ